ncbi:MAG: outer membrane beta-barrel protein, partial [Bdellovibrionota bacterium]
AAMTALLLSGASAFAAPTMNRNAYYEGYYMYFMNSPETATGTDENSGRLNDRNHNSFTTNLVELGVNGSATKEVSYVIEAGYGDLKDSVYGTVARDVLTQGYLSFALPALKGMTFDIGRFYSHMGAESFKAVNNWNFSHSLTYKYAVPHWNEGLRAHIINKKNMALSAYVLNGWDTEEDLNDSKTLGLKLRFTPSDKFDIAYNFIGGPEQGTNESNQRMVHNVNALFAINSKLAALGQFTWGKEEKAILVDSTQKSADWFGVSAAAKYAISNDSFVSGRIEHYNAEEGVRILTVGSPMDLKVTSLTGTYGVTHGEGLQTWFEARFDKADEDVIREDSTDVEDDQISFLASLMYEI